jgi:hypothetical protein
MLPRQIQITLFLALWHEIAMQFQLDIDASLLATAVVVFGHAFLRQMSFELMGMSQPLTAAFIWGGPLWVLLVVWLVPDFIWALPDTILLSAIVGLVFGGYRARQHAEKTREKLGKAWFYERSEAVVVGVFAASAGGMLSQLHWGSVLPFAGYIALLVLPAAFGWVAAAPRPQTKFDARFGDEDEFHDAGVSDDF